MSPAGRARTEVRLIWERAMSAQRRERFGTLDQVRGKPDRSGTRDFTDYELKIRPIMTQKRRKRFAEIAAAKNDPAIPPAKNWPGSRCGALPREVLLVDHAHTPLGQALFDIACEMSKEGLYLREGRGRQSAIKCEKLPDGESWLITCSDSQWVQILKSKGIKASERRVQIALKYNLHAWFSLEMQALRTTGKKGVPNRSGTKFILRTFPAILDNRRKRLVTTDGQKDETKSRNWCSGRPNSMRPISVELAGVDGFDLRILPEKGPTKFDADRAAVAKHGPPPDADERACVVPTKEQTPVPAKVYEPEPPAGQVPPDQQEILDALCGYVEGNRGTPGHCDRKISGEILANAQAAAKAHQTRISPGEDRGVLLDEDFRQHEEARYDHGLKRVSLLDLEGGHAGRLHALRSQRVRSRGSVSGLVRKTKQGCGEGRKAETRGAAGLHRGVTRLFPRAAG